MSLLFYLSRLLLGAAVVLGLLSAWERPAPAKLSPVDTVACGLAACGLAERP